MKSSFNRSMHHSFLIKSIPFHTDKKGLVSLSVLLLSVLLNCLSTEKRLTISASHLSETTKFPIRFSSCILCALPYQKAAQFILPYIIIETGGKNNNSFRNLFWFYASACIRGPKPYNRRQGQSLLYMSFTFRRFPILHSTRILIIRDRTGEIQCRLCKKLRHDPARVLYGRCRCINASFNK